MWLAFAFVSAALLGLYDVSKKYSLRDNAVIPVLLLNTLFCTLFFLPFIIGSATGAIGNDCVVHVRQCGWAEHRLVMFKAVIVLVSWLLGYIGIKHLPLTLAGPINATRPVMVLVGAVLVFGERLNLWQWAGVLTALLAFFMLSRTGRKEGIRFSHDRWIFCLVGAAVTGAMSGLYDKFLLAPASAGGAGLQPMMVQSWYNVYQLALMLLVWLWFRSTEQGRQGRFTWRWAIFGISLFLSIADAFYFMALSQEGALVSVVSMVRRGSVLVSFGVGAWLLHENHVRSKAADLAMVLLSLVLLALGGVA